MSDQPYLLPICGLVLWEAVVNCEPNFGYHPQGNGQIERANQDVGQFLQTFCAANPEDWAQFLPCLDTNLHNSPGIPIPQTRQQWMTGFEKVNRFGKAMTNVWNKLPEYTKPMLSEGEWRILNISQELRSGSPQKM